MNLKAHFAARCLQKVAVLAIGILSSLAHGMVGGNPAPELAATTRATVGLLITGENGKNSICSGVLIRPQLVLTAAHCLLGKGDIDVTVIFDTRPFAYAINAFAETNKRGLTDVEQMRKLFPRLGSDSKIVTFPGFDPDGFKTVGSCDFVCGFKKISSQFAHDLAVIKLTRPAPAGFEPVQIWQPGMPIPGLEIESVGNGLESPVENDVEEQTIVVLRTKRQNFRRVTSIEQFTSLQPWVVGIIKPILAAAEKLIGEYFLTLQSDGSATMKGDSGSGAFFTYNDLPIVVGIYSGNLDADGKRLTGGWTNLANPTNLAWIWQQIKSLEESQ